MESYYLIKNTWISKATNEVLEKWGVINGVRKLLESSYPLAQPEKYKPPKPLSGEVLAQLAVKRYGNQVNSRTFKEPNFLPLQALDKGIRCATPVCLLCKTYTLSEAEEILSLFDTDQYSILEIKSRFATVFNFRKYALKESLDFNVEKEFWDQWDDTASVSKLLRDEALRSGLTDRMIEGQLPLGTGFLVGKNYLITNYHVLEQQPLDKITAYFNYEGKNFLGQIPPVVQYKIDASFWQGDSHLDYAVTKVSELSSDELKEQQKKGAQINFSEAGSNFGWFKLNSEPNLIAPPLPCLRKRQLTRVLRNFEKFPLWLFRLISRESDLFFLAKNASWAKQLINDKDFNKSLAPDLKERLQAIGFQGEPVNIIQHPKGRQKEVVIYNNRVQIIYDDFIQYETDAEPGSSGSPIFNAQWQLVGIHHSGLLNAETGEIIGYLGTRMCRITEHLKEKLKQIEKTDSDFQALSNFITGYIDNPIEGRVFVSAGRERDIESILISEAKEFESKTLRELGKKVVKYINDSGKFKGIHIQEEKELLADDYRRNFEGIHIPEAIELGS